MQSPGTTGRIGADANVAKIALHQLNGVTALSRLSLPLIAGGGYAVASASACIHVFSDLFAQRKRLGTDATLAPATLFTERSASVHGAAAFHCRSGADEPGPDYEQRSQTSRGASTGECHHAADHYGFGRAAAEAQPPAAAARIRAGGSVHASIALRDRRPERRRRPDGGAVDGE